MKRKIKILFFVDRLLLGGIQKLLVEWTRNFDKNKFMIDFLVLDDGNQYELEEELRELGSDIYRLEKVWIKKPLDFVKLKKESEMFFKEHDDYDIVHMHSGTKNFIILESAKKAGINIRIAHSHNIDFQTKNPFKKFAGNAMKPLVKKYATDYFACSYLAGEWMFGKKEVNRNYVKIIRNAVDYDKFSYNQKVRNKIRKEFDFDNNDLVFGNVGRFSNQKNHTFLIDIFNELQKLNKNAKLIIVGIGENEGKIKLKVSELGIDDKVIFAGFRKNVNELMQAMDIFLLPSLYEGLPVVGVEAQAAGLPCFMSKDVITSEVKIDESLKFISLDKSPTEWANEILKNDLSRKNTRESLKKAGYFIEDAVATLEKFYTEKLNKEN